MQVRGPRYIVWRGLESQVIEMFLMLACLRWGMHTLRPGWGGAGAGGAFLMEATSLTKMECEVPRGTFGVSSLLLLHQCWVEEEERVWGRLGEDRTEEARDAETPRSAEEGLVCGTS